MVTTANLGIPFFDAVWIYDSSATAFINNTLEARSSAGTAFTIFDATADYLYLGSPNRFDLATFDLAVVGSVGTLTYEYASSATAWTQFVPGYSYDYTIDGAEIFYNLTSWTARAFSTSSPHAVASVPDTDTRYWIRISVSSVTTSPTVNQIRMRPYASYCRYTDVANLMQLSSDFTASTNPTADTVEDSIAAAQADIDYYTQKSWRVNWQRDEYHEFNTAGFKLARNDAFQVTQLEIWNGSAFQTRTEGRDNDYFLVPDHNIVYWSRFFLLPARFQTASSSLTWWGFGEFVLPVRISYLYGRNRFEDSRSGQKAFDLARKMAAIDIIRNHDYSTLVVSGTDKVALENKVTSWEQEIEHKIDSLKAWMVF